ncbi:hypothetical protein OPIT5_29755 [Opitutaceae bacterium TAV5]|nr:hypothetical protein OPIT5_29755 [Opitutaceae bacterium TAV5]
MNFHPVSITATLLPAHPATALPVSDLLER